MQVSVNGAARDNERWIGRLVYAARVLREPKHHEKHVPVDKNFPSRLPLCVNYTMLLDFLIACSSLFTLLFAFAICRAVLWFRRAECCAECQRSLPPAEIVTSLAHAPRPCFTFKLPFAAAACVALSIFAFHAFLSFVFLCFSFLSINFHLKIPRLCSPEKRTEKLAATTKGQSIICSAAKVVQTHIRMEMWDRIGGRTRKSMKHKAVQKQASQ